MEVSQAQINAAAARLQSAIDWSKEPTSHGSPGELYRANQGALELLVNCAHNLFQLLGSAKAEDDDSATEIVQ